MKNLIFLLGIIFTLSSCDQQHVVPSKESPEGIVSVPRNTPSYKTQDGQTVHQLPDGYTLLSYVDDEILSSKAFTFTCRCTTGEGYCSPFYMKSTGLFGCVISGNCTQCTGNLSIVNVETDGSIGIVKQDVQIYNVINENVPLLPIDSAQDFIGMQMLQSQFLTHPVIKQTLQDMEESLFSSNLQDFGLREPVARYIAININGNVAFKLTDAPNDGFYIANQSNVRCYCEDGSGCVPGKKLGVVYCSANTCTTCSMELGVSHTNGNNYTLKANQHGIITEFELQ